jgi:hypothetical protein
LVNRLPADGTLSPLFFGVFAQCEILQNAG